MVAALALIAGAGAQVVQVRHRDLRQPLIGGVAKHGHGAFGQLLGRRSPELAMQAIQFHQQARVSGHVEACEGLAWRPASIHDAAPLLPLSDQPCNSVSNSIRH